MRLNKNKNFSDAESDLAARLLHAMDGIQYGSLEIVIHDSKVVRIERREKIRFEAGQEAEKEEETSSS